MPSQSMTGYGESSFSLDGVLFTFRVRSVNARYLDVNCNFPKSFNWFEPVVDLLVRKKFQRGKIDVLLEMSGPLPQTSEINLPLLDSYKKLFLEISQGREANISFETLVQLPGLFEIKHHNWKDFRSKFDFYFARSLIKAEKHRKAEGKKTETFVKKRLQLLKQLIRRANVLNRSFFRSIRNDIRKKLIQFLITKKEILNSKRTSLNIQLARTIWSENKEEIMNFISVDASEEVERLNIHVDQMLELLKKEKENGKHLEFYLQELLREANTLTSKAKLTELNQIGIQMKVEIEKMREQVRNLE